MKKQKNRNHQQKPLTTQTKVNHQTAIPSLLDFHLMTHQTLKKRIHRASAQNHLTKPQAEKR